MQANTTAKASASRAPDISRSINEFPPFLRALRPLVADLGQLADQGTPLMTSLGVSAAAISRQFENLTPFAKAAKPALIALGNSSAKSLPALQATLPLAKQLNQVGTQAEPASKSLDQLLESLNQTGAIEQLMGVLFNGTSAANGFDADGHYVRAEPLVGGCTSYVKTPTRAAPPISTSRLRTTWRPPRRLSRTCQTTTSRRRSGSRRKRSRHPPAAPARH